MQRPLEASRSPVQLLSRWNLPLLWRALLFVIQTASHALTHPLACCVGSRARGGELVDDVGAGCCGWCGGCGDEDPALACGVNCEDCGDAECCADDSDDDVDADVAAMPAIVSSCRSCA